MFHRMHCADFREMLYIHDAHFRENALDLNYMTDTPQRDADYIVIIIRLAILYETTRIVGIGI